MIIETKGNYFVAALEGARLSEKDRADLLALGNEDLEEEILEMMDQANTLARPTALFCVSPVAADGSINGVFTGSALVRERLSGRSRCFPYIASCGTALEEWSRQYRGDFLLEFWADEIKKRFLLQGFRAWSAYIREHYRTTGHVAALNPGSLPGWPISGQAELFRILGGREFVEEAIGVTYSDTFLMLPSKTISGICFESEVFYENCQYCPLTDCPNRRAPQIK